MPCLLVVVVAPSHVLVREGRGSIGLAGAGLLAVEPSLENRLDVLASRSTDDAHAKRSFAGGIRSFASVAFGRSHQAQAGAVALLWIDVAREHLLDHLGDS